MKKASLKLSPVGYQIYHAISQLNRSFEECVDSIEHLMTLDILPPGNLRAYQIMLEEIRALVNQDLLEIINDRELHNSAYYEHLRLKWQGQTQELDEIPEAQTSKRQPRQRPAGKKGRRSSRQRKAV